MKYNFTITLLLIVLSISAQNSHHFDSMYPDVHDPVMAQGEDGRYYIFSTGMGVSVMSSADLHEWRQEPSVFSVTMTDHDGIEHSIDGNLSMPTWTTDSVPGFKGHFWAPDISRHNDMWYLYYSCSTFGKNGSAIGLAVNKTLDPKSSDYKWIDKGPVVVSHRNIDNWNAIDPNLKDNILFYGSFWDGIQMLPLSSELNQATSKPSTIARRYAPASNATNVDPYIEVAGNDTVEAGENAIEAPFVIQHNGWYYLLVSWDYCCRGKSSTYKTVYGRSRSLTGPYLDKTGQDMALGGGTLLVGPDDDYFGVGHCSAYEISVPKGYRKATEGIVNEKQWYFVSHAYDIKKNGRAKLFLKKITFTNDDWIELSENLK